MFIDGICVSIMSRDNRTQRSSPSLQTGPSGYKMDDSVWRTGGNPTVGEITGEKFSFADSNPQMPVRSQYYNSKKERDEVNDNRMFRGKYLDETTANNDADNEGTYATIKPNVDGFVYATCEDFVFEMFNTFIALSDPRRSFVTAPTFIFVLTAILNKAAEGPTSDLCRHLFGFYDKKKVYDSVLIEMGMLHQMNCTSKFAFLLPKKVSTNVAFISGTSKVVDYIHYEPECLDYEVDTLNDVIKSRIGMSKGVTQEVLEDEGLIILNNVQLTFRLNCHGLERGTFGRKQVNYIIQHNRQLSFFNDGNIRLVETELTDDFIMGFITGSNRKIEKSEIDFYGAQMKRSEVGSFIFPDISMIHQYKLNKLLQNTGFNELFQQLTVPHFLPMEKDIRLSNVIQVVDINLECIEMKPQQHSKTQTIINEPFYYYIKTATTSTIVCIGRFS